VCFGEAEPFGCARGPMAPSDGRRVRNGSLVRFGELFSPVASGITLLTALRYRDSALARERAILSEADF